MFKAITCNLALLCLYIRCAAQHADNHLYSDNLINSKGFWNNDLSRVDFISTQYPDETEPPTSRVDIGGIISNVGLKKGASILGLIVLPILLPFFLITGFIMFFIFLFVSIASVSSGTAVSTGRHLVNAEGLSDDENSIYQHVLDSDECIDRIACEIMKRVTTNKSKELLIGVMEKIVLNADLSKRLSLAAYKIENCAVYSCSWKHIFLNAFNTDNLHIWTKSEV